MPRRKEIARARRPEVSPIALYYASDGLLGHANGGDKHTYSFPTVRPKECRQVWLAIRDELLPQWIEEHPGTRPSWWYLFDPDCPRISAEDITRRGWEGWYFLELLPDLRRRLGGVGDPEHEFLSTAAEYDHGIPHRFVQEWAVNYYNGRARDIHGKPIGTEYKEGHFKGRAIDPKNPPKFESQPAYLSRHGLLTAPEKARLKPEDFAPEVIEK